MIKTERNGGNWTELKKQSVKTELNHEQTTSNGGTEQTSTMIGELHQTSTTNNENLN